jgi:putative transposase
MPTHIHLILLQLKEQGISRFINLALKSYSKYFNTKYKRKGPLWEGRFKNVLVETNEQFLHLTRYLHLNPTTAFLDSKPEKWSFSSYREYLGLTKGDNKICNYSKYLDMDSSTYKEFVEDQIDYQRKLKTIKNLILE